MSHFKPALFEFLVDLKANNARHWFKANQARYEADVREPMLTFISDFGPLLHDISERFEADPRKAGGSMFRIHRDVRFSKDKSPYKTHVGAQFRHEAGRDAHAPGFYLHLEPGGVFVGVGLWRPETAVAGRIRQAMVDDPESWIAASRTDAFVADWRLTGESLKRPPRGFDKAHPLLEDLKRKDFIAVIELEDEAVFEADFLHRFAGLCRSSAPLMRWLCDAVEVAF